MPDDAKSVEFRDMGAGKQVTYTVDRAYPTSGLRIEAIGGLRSEGWIYCAKKGDPEWSSFLDATSGERQRIYQRLSYLRKGDRLITIGQRYYVMGELQLQPGAKGPPATKAQHVVIVDAPVGAKQIAELLESSRATCDVK